jgi:D-arabinan exo alpha-(1,3)/(1,5)-arabinofuranosidase (non-reducing end)
MKRHFLLRALTISLAVLALAALSNASLLDDVTRQENGRAMRWSTGLYDPESNYDSSHISGGEKKTYCELEGPGEIRHIWWTIMGDDRRFGRTLILRIYYDDSPIPSVETPIGDFFAAGNGMQANVQTYPIEVTSFGRSLNSYWRMPFKKKFRLELEHQGHGSLCVYNQIDWMKKKKLPKDTLYFHARYHQEASPPPRFTTYKIFDGKGEGQFVGVVLSSQNIMASWFGEADDRYYIDGEKEPSLIGTGTEDYFTDAWNLRTFTNLNAGVSIKEPNAEDARVTMYRWHLNNPIPFKKSLKVEVERRSFAGYHDEEGWHGWDFKYRPDFWSSVGFWYQKGVAEPWCELAPVEKRINPEIFIETTNMAAQEALRTSPGNVVRKKSNRVCQKKSCTFMDNFKTGAWLEVPFKVEDAGNYSINVWQLLFRSLGIYEVSLHGGKLESAGLVLDTSMDFYDPWLALKENYPENQQYGTRMINKLGIYHLEPGDYYFRFECVGSNPQSFDKRTNGRGYNLGLDGISLRKMPIDDMKAWMMDYLAEEKKLFDGWISKSKNTVATLSGHIEAYKAKRGDYPKSIDDLVRRGYIKEVPRDDWNQLYQYDYPGRYNLDIYDVYSWHGNSRKPGSWIGNWEYPYKLKGAFEGEDLKRKRRSSRRISLSPHEYGIRSIPPSSGDTHMIIQLRKAGDWLELDLPDVKAGKYKVTLCLITSWNFGNLQWSLDGQKLGGPVDTFSFDVDRTVIEAGTITLTGNDHALRVESVGQHPQASGTYAGLDAILLTPVR